MRDPLYAACFFVLAAAILGATMVAVVRRTLPAVGGSRASRQPKFGAWFTSASLILLVLALVTNDLRGTGSASCLMAMGIHFLVSGWFSPRDAYF